MVISEKCGKLASISNRFEPTLNDAANTPLPTGGGSHLPDVTIASHESSTALPQSVNVPNSTTTGIALVVLAAVLWSSNGFFTQTTLLDGWPREFRGAALVFWRACFALLLLLPLVRRPTWHRVMIPMTICFVVMNWTYLTAIVNGSPANTIWLQNLAPAWVMIGAVLFFHERAAPRDWAMMTTCVAGVMFILVMEFLYVPPSPEHRWWSPVLAIASGLSYAGVIVCVKALRNHESAWLIALNHIATAIIMLPIVWWSGVSFPSGSMWFLLAGIGMLQMGLPYLLFARGLRTTPSHLASLITLLEPVLLPVWVHLTRLNDPTYQPPHWWTWIGAGFILFGLTIRTLWPAKKTAESGVEAL